MDEVAVRVGVLLGDQAEWLTDAAAFDAAGADALWLTPGPEWDVMTLAAAVAAVTHRTRLVVPVPGWPPAPGSTLRHGTDSSGERGPGAVDNRVSNAWARTLATVDRLSTGRLTLLTGSPARPLNAPTAPLAPSSGSPIVPPAQSSDPSAVSPAPSSGSAAAPLAPVPDSPTVRQARSSGSPTVPPAQSPNPPAGLPASSPHPPITQAGLSSHPPAASAEPSPLPPAGPPAPTPSPSAGQPVRVVRHVPGAPGWFADGDQWWLSVPVPDNRASWREIRADAVGRGAAGVVVPANPRLLDLLRNPDDPGERHDLLLAQG